MHEIHPTVLSLLRKLNQNGIHAILAGGAPRDVYHQKPIRDYDIFFKEDPSLSTLIDFNKLTRDMVNIGWSYGSYESYSEQLNHCTKIWDVDLISSTDGSIQIIHLDCDPLTFVYDSFDIGLCQAFVEYRPASDNFMMRYTPNFLKDSREHTLTIAAKDMTYEQYAYTCDVHIPRLKHKYPNFKVKTAPHLEEFEQRHNNKSQVP